MEAEDVIELGSSDEESYVPPRKKMKSVENAMVHIPTKIHGVTIKPIKANSANTPKILSGKNITVTKLTKPTAQSSKAKQLKTPDKPVQKPLKGITKKKITVKSNLFQNRPMVINPVNQIKKMGLQAFVNCGVTKLQNPIPIATLPALKKLPPSVTIKKTFTMPKPSISAVSAPKAVPMPPNVVKTRKSPMVQTVELDDDEPRQPSDCPQWYMRPEEQTQAGSSSVQETINNKEPEKTTYIEITIEDSPIKPPKAKRTRELSIETVVTIEDSPNKDEAIDAGSDDEPNTSKKVQRSKKTPHSKKKLEYERNLQRIEETHTFEIEIDPIAVNEPITDTATEKESSKIVTLTPDIVEVEESAVEIAQNEQGDISVVQIKPAQSEEVAGPSAVSIDSNENEFSSSYLSFINLCLQLEDSDDMKKIVEKKIKTYYRQVPKEYTQSEDFIDMVLSKVAAIKAAPEKMYLYIKDIVDELNMQRKLAKQMPVQEEKAKEEENFVGKEEDLDPCKQRQIRKLEKTIKKLNIAIRKLEMQEVDFDDDEDSVYLLTEKYKEKMVRVHAKFCQLTNSKMPSEPRLAIEPRPGLAPGPARRLEAWINRNKTLTFPDFHDVLRCVKEANVEDKLDWSDAFIMEEARDLFVRCGKKLQRRRQENEWRIATSRVTLMEDPAEQNSELKKQLEANRRLASVKETEVLNKYSDRQNQLKLEAVDINDKEADESPVESEEEENDESSSLESKQRRKERLKRLLQEQSKKNSTKKTQLTETNSNEEKIGDVLPDDKAADTVSKEQVTYDENSIQSLSDDDSNDVGSDVDELHLLQKLHSEHGRRSDSSSASSDSETPIAISDTSSSDEGNKNKEEKPCDIISIENSSYSDESDSQQNNEKRNKKKSGNKKLEESMDMDIENSSEIVAKDTCFTNDPLEDALLTSSDAESNTSGLLSSDLNKSGEDIKTTEECQSVSPADTNNTNTKIIDQLNHLETNNRNEGMSTNILDKKADINGSMISNDPVPESKAKALKSNSEILDCLLDQSSSTKRFNPTENPEDQEEPTINSISQAPTVDESLFSLTPNNLTCDDMTQTVSMLTSKSVSFDTSEILAASSFKSLVNESCNLTFLGVVAEVQEPKENALEDSKVIRSDDVCTEAEMGSEILISNVVSIRKPDLTDEALKKDLNPNQDLDDPMVSLHDSGAQIISNGNSNAETTDLLQSVTNSSTRNDSVGDSGVTEKPEQTVDSVEKKRMKAKLDSIFAKLLPRST